MKTETKHTPGPWKANGVPGADDEFQFAKAIWSKRNGKHIPIATTSLSVGKYKELSDAEQDANARLIAAAPDMLKALQVAELVCAKQTGMSYADRREAHEIVLAAIAKAKGE